MTIQTFPFAPGVSLAYARSAGASPLPGVIFLGGFRSDMGGTKALFLEERCRARGQAFLRFDYSGHGQSGGKFEDGSIGLWYAQAAAMFDLFTEGPQIIVGSSMGGWIGLLLARARPERVKALVAIAPAPDFSREVWEDEMTAEQRKTVEAGDYFQVPTAYGAPYTFSKVFFDGSRDHLLLHAPITVDCPVRILQGKMDHAVPWQKAERIRSLLTSQDVEVTYIDDGDHSLSRPSDLEILDSTIRSF